MEKQLDERESDGLRVELLYDDEWDEVTIVVQDTQFQECFVLRPPKDRVMEYFLHPFAFRNLTTPTGSDLVERISAYSYGS